MARTSAKGTKARRHPRGAGTKCDRLTDAELADQFSEASADLDAVHQRVHRICRTNPLLPKSIRLRRNGALSAIRTAITLCDAAAAELDGNGGGE